MLWPSWLARMASFRSEMLQNGSPSPSLFEEGPRHSLQPNFTLGLYTLNGHADAAASLQASLLAAGSDPKPSQMLACWLTHMAQIQ